MKPLTPDEIKTAQEWEDIFTKLPENSIIIKPADGGYEAAREGSPVVAKGRSPEQALGNLMCAESGGSCGIGMDWGK